MEYGKRKDGLPDRRSTLGKTQFFDPVTNHDVQQALSWVMGHKTIMILPLSSGKFAVFGHDFQLYDIYNNVPDGDTIRQLSIRLSGKKKIDRIS